MHAEQSPVASLIKVELCQDCPLRQGHSDEPEYIHNAGKMATGMRTELQLLSEGSNTAFKADGIRTNAVLVQAFENCVEPTAVKSIFSSRRVGCAALEGLRIER